MGQKEGERKAGLYMVVFQATRGWCFLKRSREELSWPDLKGGRRRKLTTSVGAQREGKCPVWREVEVGVD